MSSHRTQRLTKCTHHRRRMYVCTNCHSQVRTHYSACALVGTDGGQVALKAYQQGHHRGLDRTLA